MEVKYHFHVRIWLHIGRYCDPSECLKELQEINKYYYNRYLVVLDDVRSEDVLAELIMGLPDGKNGSRVIITSRFRDIARLGDPRSIQHAVHFLHEDHSLVLLLAKALHCKISDVYKKFVDELVPVAKQLCKKCGGVPLALALALLGTRLSKIPPSYNQWLQVLNTFDWNSDEYEMNPLNQLITSYHDLQDLRKSCFRYLAIFPKDYEIPAKYLYMLWIAAGLVIPKGTVALEEIAEDYLENLIERSMVEVHKKDSNGAIKSCRVNILFHKLAIILAKESNFLVRCDEEGINADLSAARCVTINNHFEINELKKKDMPSVRSFLNFGKYVPFQMRFMLVRVLELRGAKNLKYLPKGLQNMIHLRYLGLRSTNVKRIPKKIGRLQNLQTLDVRETNVTYIPVSLWKIKTLRHVYGSKPRNSFLIPDGPPPEANLVKLQTLSTFNVPKSWAHSLPHLPRLLRKLGLSCYTKTKEPKSKPNWMIVTSLLGKLGNLESLAIYGDHIPSHILHIGTSPSYNNIKSILICGHGSKLSLGTIEMPPKITKLTLIEVELDQDPMPKLANLKNLEVFRLIRAVIIVNPMVCPAKGFPELRKLEIDSCFTLEELLEREEGAMPKLKLTDLIINNSSEPISQPDLAHVFTC